MPRVRSSSQCEASQQSAASTASGYVPSPENADESLVSRYQLMGGIFGTPISVLTPGSEINICRLGKTPRTGHLPDKTSWQVSFVHLLTRSFFPREIQHFREHGSYHQVHSSLAQLGQCGQQTGSKSPGSHRAVVMHISLHPRAF